MAQTSPAAGLTIAMIVRDGGDLLDAALDSVEGLAGRVVVLDTGSSDGTPERLRARGGIDLLERADFPGFGPARRQALESCRTPWVFFLDADERVTPELAAAIRRTVEADAPAPAGWRVRRENHVLGRRMRSMGLDRDRPLRLFRRERARITDTLVHEVVAVDGEVATLEGALEHRTLVSLDDYLRKIDHYTTLELRQRPRRLRLWHLAFVGPGTFVREFFFRGGWRDGVPGLVWAGLTATGRFIRDMKIWIAHQPGAEGPPAEADGPSKPQKRGAD